MKLTKTEKILLCGATGYLGQYLLRELKAQGYFTTSVARNPDKLKNLHTDKVIRAEVTEPKTLEGICEGIDIVISTIGITRQKDGLNYVDVDYQANVNLLHEALSSHVKKFIYVSVLNAHKMRNLKMVAAKERFVDKLESCGMEYLIIRPNGFFSDMKEVLHMAKKGRIFLFGKGEYRGNPIHGGDLANFIVGNMDRKNKELEVGGPQVLTQNEIARAAFDALKKRGKIIHIPVWITDIFIKLIRWLTGPQTYGPIEFFMTVMTMDMIAPLFGTHRLLDYYRDFSR